jgi:hypothetical protein
MLIIPPALPQIRAALLLLLSWIAPIPSLKSRVTAVSALLAGKRRRSIAECFPRSFYCLEILLQLFEVLLVLRPEHTAFVCFLELVYLPLQAVGVAARKFLYIGVSTVRQVSSSVSVPFRWA